jgi:hypothetical protein
MLRFSQMSQRNDSAQEGCLKTLNCTEAHIFEGIPKFWHLPFVELQKLLAEKLGNSV